ncbi:MAG: acetylornithine transaminase [Syntrophales bacterium]|nr:acetylornithine transaminase [Syntrophales bacterium]MDD5232761.1 acetylornithine transaminase [Syntrophales bacterium]
MTTEECIGLAKKYLMNTYSQAPIVLLKGNGARVWDEEGKEYLDFAAGIAVNNLGHAHPKVVEAIRKQAGVLMHVSNLYYIDMQIRFGRMLVENSFAGKVFFCNSGAEANEAAIKLARKYGRDRMGGKFGIITMENAFHGRTLATLAATGQKKYQEGFEPLPDGFRQVPFNDTASLEKAVDAGTCAVMLEPIQGVGGVIVPGEDYLKEVRELCTRKGILMILDEVQTGMGRTGRLFAHQLYGVVPDIMTLAKGIGGGFPLGAMLAADDVASAFGPGSHASTFGGNPLAMAASAATLRTMLDEKIPERAAEIGMYFFEKLVELRGKHAGIGEIRGKGLMLGMELGEKAPACVAACREKGLLIDSTTRSLRFVPPLIVTRDEVNRAADIIDEVLNIL